MSAKGRPERESAPQRVARRVVHTSAQGRRKLAKARAAFGRPSGGPWREFAPKREARRVVQ